MGDPSQVTAVTDGFLRKNAGCAPDRTKPDDHFTVIVKPIPQVVSGRGSHSGARFGRFHLVEHGVQVLQRFFYG